MKTHLLSIYFLYVAGIFFAVGLYLLWQNHRRIQKQRAFEMLQRIGRSLGYSSPILCCVLSEDPPHMTFKSEFLMDEIMNVIREKVEFHGYKLSYLCSDEQHTLFYLIRDKIKIRFKLMFQAALSHSGGKAIYMLKPY